MSRKHNVSLEGANEKAPKAEEELTSKLKTKRVGRSKAEPAAGHVCELPPPPEEDIPSD